MDSERITLCYSPSFFFSAPQRLKNFPCLGSTLLIGEGGDVGRDLLIACSESAPCDADYVSVLRLHDPIVSHHPLP